MTVDTECNVMIERRHAAKDRGRGYKPRNLRIAALRTGKGKEMSSPLESLKEYGFGFNLMRPLGPKFLVS